MFFYLFFSTVKWKFLVDLRVKMKRDAYENKNFVIFEHKKTGKEIVLFVEIT